MRCVILQSQSPDGDFLFLVGGDISVLADGVTSHSPLTGIFCFWSFQITHKEKFPWQSQSPDGDFLFLV